MPRCRLFAPVFATLVISLFLFTGAVAQEDPITPPGASLISDPAPAEMAFQPPPDADSLDDFLPPGLTLEHIPAAVQQRATVPFAGRDGKAASFGNRQVALIIEGGAFPVQSEIQFTALPVPADRGAAEDATSPGPLATSEPVTGTTALESDLIVVTATPTATVPLTMTPSAESVVLTATATLTNVLPATPTAAAEAPVVSTPVTTTATLTPTLPPTSTGTAEAPLATTAITATNTITNPVESSDLVRFQLDVVDRATGESSPLVRPARIVVDLRPLTQGLNPIYNRFYLAYQDAEDPLVWHEVPIQVHQAGGLISAEVFHFSHWAAGVRPERWNPSWTPPVVSTFSGAATYAYPIQAPPGRNGLQPSVSLSYSSRALDGHIRDTEPGDVAHGWSLAQISIVRENVRMRMSPDGSNRPVTHHPDRFRLVFDGAGYELYPQSPTTNPTVQYYAKELPGFLIHRYYDAAAPNQDGIYWILKSPEGVHYRLGYLGNTHHSEEWQETAEYFVYIDGHGGNPVVGESSSSAIAWHVDTVTDPFGNQMTYHYNRKTNGERIDWYNIDHWTSFVLNTFTSRLDTIRYNYPTRVTALPPSQTVAPLTSTAGTLILFRDQSATVETDPITNIYVFHAGNTSTPIMEYRLTPAALFVDSPSCMNYDTVPAIPRRTNTRVITAIQQFTATDADPLTSDAGYALPKTEFSYSYKAHFTKNGGPCFQFYYLTGFRNGYGGEATFTYDTDNRSAGDYIHYTYNHYEWPHIGYSYFVSQMISNDGRNPATKVGYAYYKPCYSQTDGYVGAMPDATRCVSPDAPAFGPIVGFERTTQTFRGYANEVLNLQITTFTQNADGSIGQPTMEELKNSGGTLLTCTRTIYQSHTLGPTSFSKPDYVDRRIYGSGGDCAAVAVNQLVSGAVIQSVTNYDYDGYGNVTTVWQDSDRSVTTDDRKVVTQYVPNTTASRWIVSKPARELQYRGFSGPVLLVETQYLYDANAGYNAAPTQGALKKVLTGNAASPPDGATSGFITSAQYGHDVYGNVTSTTSPRGTVTTAVYETGYNLYSVKVTNHLNHITTYDFYGFKRADGTVAPMDGFQRQPGLLRRTADANGVATGYEYDPFGRLHAVYDAEDSYAGFANADPWDGNPLQRIRYWDNVWNNSAVYLDPANNKPFEITVEQRPGSWTQAGNGYAYNDQTFYDGLGRPIQSRSVFAEVDGQSLRREIYSSTAYDARGNVSCQTVPYDLPYYYDRGLVWPASPFDPAACTSKPRTTTTYDALNRPDIVTAPDGSTTDNNHHVLNSETVGGTNRLLLHQVIDANRHVVNYLYDAADRLVQVRNYTGTDPWTLYASTTYTYDVVGNLVNVTDAAGNVTTMSYDALGRKKAMTDPDMGSWSYGYDAAGNLVWQKDANNKKLCFTYDVLDRVRVRYEDTTPLDSCPAVPPPDGPTHLASYTYDPTNGKGQVATVSWGPTPTQNRDTFTYDTRGRMTKQTRLIDGRSYTLETLTFDPLNRPLTVRYPNGDLAFIGYDREGENSLQIKRPTDTNNQPLVATIKYNGRGQLTLLDRSAVADTTYLYHPQTDAAGGGTGDSNFRLKTIRHGSAGDAWFDFTYQYDKVGNITQLLANNGASDTQTFTYDALNRLAGVSGSYSAAYHYSTIGNLSTPAANSYNYTTWNAACTPPGQSLPHAVKQIGGSYFCYDKNGNMTVRYHGSITYNQTFDIENRLVSVNKVGTGTTTFAYDAAGQRVKTVKPSGGGTIYTPFPNYEEELRGTATIRHRTYALAGQAVAVQVDGDPTAANNGLFYYYADHLGSATVLNKGGTKVAGSETYYAPFGGYRNAPTTNPAISDRGYTGHRHNNELGLIYMNARYYVPAIGRFASADTIVPDPADPQSFNRYAYTLNNPLRYTDPTGHCAQDDDACWELAEEMYRLYGWRIDGIWTIDQIRLFLQAGQAITDWFARNGGGNAIGRMRAVLGGTLFAHSDLVGHFLNAHHVRGNTVFLRDNFDLGTIVHELGHVLDNRLGFNWPIGSALFGGSTADGMARTLGADPASCGWNRSRCSGYETPNERIRSEDEFIAYSLNGPSEDFAQSFMLSVLQGSTLQSSYPLRAAVLADLAVSLTTIQSEYSLVPQPYLTRRIVPVAAPTPPAP